MVIMSFKSKKDAGALIEKAHKAKKHVEELVECLEDAVEEMEEEYGHLENYRHDPYYDRYDRVDNRYGYMRKMR